MSNPYHFKYKWKGFLHALVSMVDTYAKTGPALAHLPSIWNQWFLWLWRNLLESIYSPWNLWSMQNGRRPMNDSMLTRIKTVRFTLIFATSLFHDWYMRLEVATWGLKSLWGLYLRFWWYFHLCINQEADPAWEYPHWEPSFKPSMLHAGHG